MADDFLGWLTAISKFPKSSARPATGATIKPIGSPAPIARTSWSARCVVPVATWRTRTSLACRPTRRGSPARPCSTTTGCRRTRSRRATRRLYPDRLRRRARASHAARLRPRRGAVGRPQRPRRTLSRWARRSARWLGPRDPHGPPTPDDRNRCSSQAPATSRRAALEALSHRASFARMTRALAILVALGCSGHEAPPPQPSPGRVGAHIAELARPTPSRPDRPRISSPRSQLSRRTSEHGRTFSTRTQPLLSPRSPTAVTRSSTSLANVVTRERWAAAGAGALRRRPGADAHARLARDP